MLRGAAGTPISFVLLGGLVAADARVPLHAMTVLACLLGLVHGYLNGAAMAQAAPGALGVLGIVVGVFTLVALAASWRHSARRGRVMVRVAGSWIAASGLLLLGWSLRPGA